MKNLNLNAMGVTEMNAKEMRTVDGGCFGLCLAAAAALLLSGCTIVIGDDNEVGGNGNGSGNGSGNGNGQGNGNGGGNGK